MLHTPGAHSDSSSARSALASPAPILLASASPRRAQILQTLGIAFRIVGSAFRETPPRAEDHANPSCYVEYLAREKARGCGDKNPQNLVLTADTSRLASTAKFLGKPARRSRRRFQMLHRLRGNEHQRFYRRLSALEQLVEQSSTRLTHETTTVRFRDAFPTAGFALTCKPASQWTKPEATARRAKARFWSSASKAISGTLSACR